MKNTLIVILTILLMAAVGYIYIDKQPKPQLPQPQVQTAVPHKINWSFKDAGTDSVNISSTTVSVNIDGKENIVGTYQGSCSQTTSDRLTTDELSAVICWYAGSGDELAAFLEQGSVVIKHRQIDEGTAEDGGYMSDWETVALKQY